MPRRGLSVFNIKYYIDRTEQSASGGVETLMVKLRNHAKPSKHTQTYTVTTTHIHIRIKHTNAFYTHTGRYKLEDERSILSSSDIYIS